MCKVVARFGKTGRVRSSGDNYRFEMIMKISGFI